MCDVGDLIDGRYLLERIVGSGGMGIVYLARDSETGEQVAVKVLRANASTSGDVRARLQREIQLLSQLHSPYVAELRAAGCLDDGMPYFVMEYLEGRDLKAELRLRGPLPCAEAVAYLVQTCRGMAVAHRQGIVHRDLKPHNLIVTGLNGVRTIKIVDFGVAKSLDTTDPGLTATNTAVGTPLYMSPEQLIDARAISTKADVWALGVILYELLAGFSPFLDDSPGAVIAAVTLDEPVAIRRLRPDVPEGVARAIAAAMTKLPAERLGSVGDLEALLLEHAAPVERLIVRESDANCRVEDLTRPARTRVSAYLREQILASIDGASTDDRATVRCLRAAPEVCANALPERLSLVPSLRSLAPKLPAMIALDARGENTGPMQRDRKRRADGFAKIIGLSILATVLALGAYLLHDLRLKAAEPRSTVAFQAKAATLPDATKHEASDGPLAAKGVPEASGAQAVLGSPPSPATARVNQSPRAPFRRTIHKTAAISTVVEPLAQPQPVTAAPAKMVPKHL